MTPDRTRPLVLGVGEILWDLFPEGRQLGGAPANFAYHANALGARGTVVSAVGDDDLGRDLLDRLDALGVGRDGVAVVPGVPSGTVTVRVDGAGHPEYTIHENVAWDRLPLSKTALRLAETADAVCFGSLAQRDGAARATIRSILEACSASCIRVFDINLRQQYFDRACILESLRLATLCKLNDEELPVLARFLDLPAGMGEADSLDAIRDACELDMVALTRGKRGCRIVAAGERVDHEGVTVEVADTVGAGDAFTAGLVAGLLAGWSLQDVTDHAVRLAAHVCAHAGATPDIPAGLKVFPVAP